MLSSLPANRFSTAEWHLEMMNHRERAEGHTRSTRKRRDRGEPHPVEDFLFQYYPYPFALLENWQPGVGVALECETQADGSAFSGKHYAWLDGWLFAEPGLLTVKERERLGWIEGLLSATRDRPGNFACHGLHEWAMVYRGKEVRHSGTTRLRLPQEEIDQLVESRVICCSHHDAFRFFTNESRPLNRLQPTLDTRVQMEQPGCVHANMDLYKWAAKSMPWVGSDVLMDCFELAMKLRDLDMRASPYDLSAWGREPVCIETSEGRREYESEQRRLAGLAMPLRDRLIGMLERTLAA